LFALGSFFLNTEVAPTFWAALHGKSYALFLTKIGWATFWAIF
jgi:hypothetical protein